MNKQILGKYNVGEVKPAKRGQSDKWSWNLYRWLTRKHRENHRVYDMRWCRVTGNFREHNPLDLSACYVGYLDSQGWFHGRRLFEILCNSPHGNLESYAYPPKNTKDMIEITEWFWPRYLRIGRAIFDLPNRPLIDRGRFTRVGNTRRCNWSGNWEKCSIVTRKTFTRCEYWSAV